MSEPTLLVTKLGQLDDADRAMLREAGIIVLEVQRPEEVRFIRPHAELGTSDLLRAAMVAIKAASFSTQSDFAEAVAKAILDKPQPASQSRETGE
jgi:hypothetical protein